MSLTIPNLSRMAVPKTHLPEILIKDRWRPEVLDPRLVDLRSGLGAYVREAARLGLLGEQIGELLDRLTRSLIVESQLTGIFLRNDQHPHMPTSREYLGVLSRKVVTTAGVNYIVDAFQNSVELENLKYHGFGTGTNAEAVGDTALQTELTTEYATDNTRPTGTTTEGASANIYRTVATLSPDSGGTLAITEHGVFSQAANSGGTLLDRSKFSAVNIVAALDSLQATYDLTLTAGS